MGERDDFHTKKRRRNSCLKKKERKKTKWEIVSWRDDFHTKVRNKEKNQSGKSSIQETISTAQK